MKNPQTDRTLRLFSSMALVALLTSSLIGCSQIDAPQLSGEDVVEDADSPDVDVLDVDSPDVDISDVFGDQDTSPPPTCSSNFDCNAAKQFCHADSGTCRNYPQLALAGQHSCAILSHPGGEVKCWGNNSSGQLGIGNTPNGEVPTPTPVQLPGPAKLISAGFVNTCVVLISDEIYCWGHSVPTDLQGNTRRVTSPEKITHNPLFEGSPIIQIESGNTHNCVLHENGRIYCWGGNSRGQLGVDDPNIGYSSSTQPIHHEHPAGHKQIAAAYSQTCAITFSNKVHCWGNNTDNHLGLNFINDQSVDKLDKPAEIPNINGIVDIQMGTDHTCVLDTQSHLKCWGNNHYGQLGIGVNPSIQPPPTTSPFDYRVKQVATGQGYTWILPDHEDPRPHVAGINSQGQLAMGNTGAAQYSIFIPNSKLSSIHHLEAGPQHSCAIHKNGTVSCWGVNFNAQLGTGEASDVIKEPTKITLN